jgi:Flp pilus assembly pilin Flp
MKKTPSQSIVRRLRRNRVGAVMVEYAFLLTFVVVPGATALLIGGRAQYLKYLEIRSELLSPFP